MDLTIIERKPQIGLILSLPRQTVPLHVGCIVVVFLMVAHSWHEGSVGCEAFSEFSKKIPNRFKLSNFFRVHPSISDISSQKNKVKGLNEVISGDLFDDKMAEGGKSTHITKDSHVNLLELLNFQRRCFELFDLGKSSSFVISDPVVISLQGFQLSHDGFVDPSMKANMSNVIGSEGAFDLLFEVGGQPAVLNDGFVVELGSGNPHNLHFSFFISESNVDLFVSCLRSDLYLCYLDELFESDPLVLICVEERMDRSYVFLL